MIPLFWLLTMLSCMVGGFFLMIALLASTGAPQEAAGAAIAVAFAVVPYCFTRALEGFRRP